MLDRVRLTGDRPEFTVDQGRAMVDFNRQLPDEPPPPAGFQFQLKTLFLLIAITAVVLLPARLLLADPVFRLAAAGYGVILAAYFVLRGPFLYARLRRLQLERHQIEQQRRKILEQAQQRKQRTHA